MRRRLLLVVVATTSLVVVAFAVPLGALVRSVARDRALSAAERDLGSLAPVLAVATETAAVQDAMARTGAGADGRLTVWLPDGTRLGDLTPDDASAGPGPRPAAVLQPGPRRRPRAVHGRGHGDR